MIQTIAYRGKRGREGEDDDDKGGMEVNLFLKVKKNT